MSYPMLIGSGRTAAVYALDERRVLRRYLDGGDARAEAAVMAYAREHGYHVPEVHSADGPELVMERIDGATMLELLVDGRLGAAEGGAVLAGLLRRLHSLPLRPGGVRGERLLHLDLHPGNVVMGAAGPVVIDWTNARDGDPALDLAVTAVTLGMVVETWAPPLAAQARAMLAAYVAAVDLLSDASIAAAVAFRSADPHLEPAEVAALGRAAEIVRGMR